MQISFWKMSGCGNDFIVIDARGPDGGGEQTADIRRGKRIAGIVIEDISAFIAKVCRRGLSVGADGVILVEHSKKADYAWHYYNADGGEASMCGNGLRCVARFAYLNGIAPMKHTIETGRGIMHAEIRPNGRVMVQMPDPIDCRLRLNIEIDGTMREGHFVNTGVPHVIYFVDDVEKVDVVRQGRATRHHPLFAKEGTNANFVQISNPHFIKIRTYERGVEDETLACGTGSVAAAVIASALGKTNPALSVETRSGITLGVHFKKDALTFSEVHLEGDARIIYKGELSEEALL
jgi:diaminopimelate epimerase